LNKGNTHTKLRVGNVVTAEPGNAPKILTALMIGVYIEGVVGVRLEDVILVTENGPELLSGKRATDWLHLL
jgi:Xaa-Pro aminopeptidase